MAFAQPLHFLDIFVFQTQFPEEGIFPLPSPPAHISGWFAGRNHRTIRQGSLDSSAHFQRATMIGIGKLTQAISDGRHKEYPHGKVFCLVKVLWLKKMYLMSGSLLQNSCSRSLDSSMSWLFRLTLPLSVTWYVVSIDYTLQPQCRFKHVYWRLQQRSWIAFNFQWSTPSFLHGIKVHYIEISRICFCSVRRNCIGQSIGVEICFICDNI